MDFDQMQFITKIINKDSHNPELTEYSVKFYDDPVEVKVNATNFTTAGILAMAYIIHFRGTGFAIQYIESSKSGNKVCFEI